MSFHNSTQRGIVDRFCKGFVSEVKIEILSDKSADLQEVQWKKPVFRLIKSTTRAHEGETTSGSGYCSLYNLVLMKKKHEK